MEEARALKLYGKFVRLSEAVDTAVRDRCVNAWKVRVSDEVADLVDVLHAEFGPCVEEGQASQDARFKRLNDLLGTLSSEPAARGLSLQECTLVLLRWNKWFQLKQVKLNMPPILSAAVVEIVREIHDGSSQKSQGFREYCAKAADPHRKIFDMRKAFELAGLPKPNVYMAMHFLQQHALPLERLNEKTATDIHFLSQYAPPLTAFTGFNDWGPGNNQDVAKNKAMHFLKHVLDAHPEEDLPWAGECAVWWETLKIELTGEQAAAKMGPAFSGVKAMFDADTKMPLPWNKVEAFVVKLKKAWPQALLEDLALRYEKRYVDHAIDMSRRMTNIIVHVDNDGKNVFLKGLCSKFYLGARIHEGALGLSTCFVPKPDMDLQALHEDRKLWRVSPL